MAGWQEREGGIYNNGTNPVKQGAQETKTNIKTDGVFQDWQVEYCTKMRYSLHITYSRGNPCRTGWGDLGAERIRLLQHVLQPTILLDSFPFSSIVIHLEEKINKVDVTFLTQHHRGFDNLLTDYLIFQMSSLEWIYIYKPVLRTTKFRYKTSL